MDRLAAIERLLERAAREVQLLATLTPVDAHVERARLVREVTAERHARPRWRYVPVAHEPLCRALDAAAQSLRDDGDPTAILYRERAREIALEADLCAAAGTHRVAALAVARFEPRDERVAREASDLCRAWLSEPAPERAKETIASDSPDSRSLLSRMRAAVGAARLPFSVVAQPGLAPLAATGDRAILVATGRALCEEDALRTVLHEIEGHARPRARAASAPAAVFRIGTARGVDDQEGRALVVEQRAGLLGARRRRQLAARHRAVEAMLDGATFHDVANALVREHGLDAQSAVVTCERAFRGGPGDRAGLGRERVYLESFVRVRAGLARRPEDERAMEMGQIAMDAASKVRETATRTSRSPSRSPPAPRSGDT